MRYVSTRGAWAARPAAVLGDPARRPGARRRPRRAAGLSASSDAEQSALRRLAYPGLAHAILSPIMTDIPEADSEGAHRPHVHEDDLRHRRDRAGDGTGAGRSPAARVERTDACVQGHRAAASRQSLRVHAREAREHAQHPRRDVRRHGQRRGVRDARQARHRRLHALAEGPDEPVPAGADVFAARAEHPQHRDRRRLRRLPGHRQGGVRRCRVQDALPDRHGQFDQLGTRRRAGRLLFQRLFRRDEGARRAGRLRRSVRQFRQHSRRPRRARRWGCRSAA